MVLVQATLLPVQEEFEYSAVHPENPLEAHTVLQLPLVLVIQVIGAGVGVAGTLVGVGSGVGSGVGNAVGAGVGIGEAVGGIGEGDAVGNGVGAIVGTGEPDGIAGNAVRAGLGSSASQIIPEDSVDVSHAYQVVYPAGQMEVFVFASSGA